MLNIQNLLYTINGSDGIRNIIDNMSFEITKGQFVSIVGTNGTGKSTLINAISGNIKCNSGKIIIDGQDVANHSQYQRAKFIAKVVQSPSSGTFGEMTIFENLAFAMSRNSSQSFKSYKSDQNIDLCIQSLKILGLGLENRLNNFVSNLSGGQKQSLSLVMATMAEAKLLLLDEHTAALDPKTSESIMQITKDISKKKDLTAIMITHNLKHAVKYSDRIIALDKGKILLDVEVKDNNITEERLYEMVYGT